MVERPAGERRLGLSNLALQLAGLSAVVAAEKRIVRIEEIRDDLGRLVLADFDRNQ